MVDKLHLLTNRGLGLGLDNQVLDNNTVLSLRQSAEMNVSGITEDDVHKMNHTDVMFMDLNRMLGEMQDVDNTAMCLRETVSQMLKTVEAYRLKQHGPVDQTTDAAEHQTDSKDSRCSTVIGHDTP